MLEAMIRLFINIFSRPSYCEKKLGYKFKNKKLFRQALMHKSWMKGNSPDNERMEYLGDAVLNLALGDVLMKKYPHAQEGILSKMRSSLVSTKGLYKQALNLNIGKELELSAGAKAHHIRRNARLMASFFEAIIGAIYLDSGYVKAQKVISIIFQKDLNQTWVDEDYKTILQGKSQKMFQQTPEYRLLNSKGPAHRKIFVVQVYVKSKKLGIGKGGTKKDAEQSSAEEALKNFDRVFNRRKGL